MAFLSCLSTSSSRPHSSRIVMKCSAASTEDYLRAAVRSMPSWQTDVNVTVTDVTVAPGQQNEHFRLEVDQPGGAAYLAKVSRRGGVEAFAGERASLTALAKTSASCGGDLLVTAPVLVGTIDSGLRAYSIFPWIHFAPFGAAIPDVQRALATGMARIHQASAEDTASHRGQFGFGEITYLGPLPQDNRWTSNWVHFFIAQRLRPLWTTALKRFSNFYGTSNETANALCTLGTRIIQEDSDVVSYLFDGINIRPSLVHGDLFMGNCGATVKERRAVVYDPASFYGHDEYDLALSSMWGRFSHEFYTAYHDERGPPQARFADRQLIYRLHYLLQMLVIHGPGFGSGGSSAAPDG